MVRTELLDNKNKFARTLNLYMESAGINDMDMSEILDLPIGTIVDIRMGVIFGAIKKDSLSKIDKVFSTEKGYFKKILRESVSENIY